MSALYSSNIRSASTTSAAPVLFSFISSALSSTSPHCQLNRASLVAPEVYLYFNQDQGRLRLLIIGSLPPFSRLKGRKRAPVKAVNRTKLNTTDVHSPSNPTGVESLWKTYEMCVDDLQGRYSSRFTRRSEDMAVRGKNRLRNGKYVGNPPFASVSVSGYVAQKRKKMYPSQNPQMPQQEMIPDMSIYQFPGYPPAMYPWMQQQQMMQMFQNNAYMYSTPSTSEGPPPTPKEGLKKSYPPLLEQKHLRKSKFDDVSGRLCLLSGCKKYVVTAGEIFRRMSAPETLHTSLLNGILRNAKAKDNGSKLRSKLQYFKVQLPQGRRKTCRPTGFTALCEAESVELAGDLRKLLESQGGANDIAEYLLESDPAYCNLSTELAVFSRWMVKLIEIYPEVEDPDDITPKNLAEEAINHTSLLTHGFSHIAIPVVLRFALMIAKKMENPDEMKIDPSSSQSLLPGTPNAPMNMLGMASDASSPAQMSFGMPPAFPNPYNCYMNMASPWAHQQPMMPAMIYNDFNPYSAAPKAEISSPQSPPAKKDLKTYEPLLKDEVERRGKFDECSARLQLLSASRKYVVTTGEVCRRMAAPETLHSSLINGILRNAKAKDNSTKLRTRLQHYNIELPQGRRKTCDPTKFTSMCEEESWSLAKDFEELILDDMHGGAQEIGAHLATMADENFSNEAEIATKWLQKIIAEHPAVKAEDIAPTNKAQRAVHHLSLITHGFSHVAVPAVLRFAVKTLEVAVQAKKNPCEAQLQPQPMMMMPPMIPFYPQ